MAGESYLALNGQRGIISLCLRKQGSVRLGGCCGLRLDGGTESSHSEIHTPSPGWMGSAPLI